jgi:hypothetical protein
MLSSKLVIRKNYLTDCHSCRVLITYTQLLLLQISRLINTRLCLHRLSESRLVLASVQLLLKFFFLSWLEAMFDFLSETSTLKFF